MILSDENLMSLTHDGGLHLHEIDSEVTSFLVPEGYRLILNVEDNGETVDTIIVAKIDIRGDEVIFCTEGDEFEYDEAYSFELGEDVSMSAYRVTLEHIGDY